MKNCQPCVNSQKPFLKIDKDGKRLQQRRPFLMLTLNQKKKQMQKKRDDHDVKRSSVDLQCDSFQELLDLVVSPPMFLFAVLPLL